MNQSTVVTIVGKYYRGCIMLCILLIFTSCVTLDTIPKSGDQERAVLAFPGAEGFGCYTSGGRGGQVIYVTTLNDHGPGSLREALETKGPRYVLFKLSGTIALESEIRIQHGDLTLAGQSAPGDGICLKNYPLILDADNIIIRFMRFRLGDQSGVETDALSARFRKDIIIDHCSMSWSVDETVSLYVNENTTLQWSIISESLNNSNHSKGRHGYGGIWGGRYASFHHNLLAHHNSRNPRLGERAGDDFALTDLVDLRNNVIYNWGSNSCYGGEGMNVNIVNCYYKPGPASKNRERIVAIDKNLNEGTPAYNTWGKYYVNGNFIEGSDRATEDNWAYGVLNQFNKRYAADIAEAKIDLRLDRPHNIYKNVSTDTPQVAYNKVLDWAGASYRRDAVDDRIVSNVINGDFSHDGSKGSSLGIIDSQDDVGGWPLLKTEAPLLDTSGDGMPDVWKNARHLSLDKNDTNGHDLDCDYENVEIYLNELVAHLFPKQ